MVSLHNGKGAAETQHKPASPTPPSHPREEAALNGDAAENHYISVRQGCHSLFSGVPKQQEALITFDVMLV